MRDLEYEGCVAIIIAAIELARKDAERPYTGRESRQREYWRHDAHKFLNALGELRTELGRTPIIDLARLRRSLNLELTVVTDGQRRGIKVTWARRGRSGLTLWDELGNWVGMPARIEAAVYDGLSVADQSAIVQQIPTSFTELADAIAWGFAQGAFDDAVHAQYAYDKLKATHKPATAPAMWVLWLADVQQRLAVRLANAGSSHRDENQESEF